MVYLVLTLFILARAIKIGTYENTAVVDSDTFDPNPDNKTSSVTVRVVSKPKPGPCVPMQPTGAPLTLLALGILTLIGGTVYSKKRK